MAKTIIKATYKAEDEFSGYIPGTEYDLAVEHNKIQRTNGSGIKVYASVQSFLKDWCKIKEIKK